MTHGLNFYRFSFMVFLSFVSIWVVSPGFAQEAKQTKDEFADFAKELETTEAQKIPKVTPSPTIIAPVKTTPTPAPAPTVAPTPIPSPSATASPVVVAPPVVPHEDKIEQLKKEIRQSPKNASLISDLADELYKKGEYEKATLLLWKHVDKIDRRGLIILVKAHEQRKEPSEMVRALNVLIGKNDKDFEAYSLLGNAHVLGKKNKEALENYKKAVELNPKYEPAYDGLIALYENREPPNLYELRILFQDLIDNIGNRSQYLRKLCEINTLDGTYEAAIQICKDAIAKDPTQADPHVYLGLCYKAISEATEAQRTLKKAAEAFPKSEFAQFQYGKLLEEQKNYVDAMKRYKKGTEVDGKAARSWLGLATSAFEIRKYELSLIAYKNACKYDKKNAVAFRKATSILRNQKNGQWIGKFEDASENCTF